MSRSKQRSKCKHSCNMCDPGKHSPGVPKVSDRRRMYGEDNMRQYVKGDEPMSDPRIPAGRNSHDN